MQRRSLMAGLAAIGWLLATPAFAQTDPLPSWNEGPVKRAILDFVPKVTTAGNRDFVPMPERIACFDNDGTLWTEQPNYFQVIFAMDRVKALAARHPEWKALEPFKWVIEDNRDALAAMGEKGMLEIMVATHSGLTTEEFMRPWTERTYGIPPEQVVGSSGVTKYVLQAPDRPVLRKESKVEFIDDGPGKAEGINRFIGRRPVFSFGNSDGDQQMLEWTAAGTGARFMGLVHHTDAVREYAYDRDSPIGRLDKAWDEAVRRKWIVVDMKNDWKVIYPFEVK